MLFAVRNTFTLEVVAYFNGDGNPNAENEAQAEAEAWNYVAYLEGADEDYEVVALEESIINIVDETDEFGPIGFDESYEFGYAVVNG